MKNKKGWTWISNSPKSHYFDDGRSLCGKWMYLGNHELRQGNDGHSDNCMACRRKIEKPNEQRHKT